MRVKWKNNKALNPKLILERISAGIKKMPDGSLGFDVDVLELEVLLFTMLDFAEDYSNHNALYLLKRAVRACAEEGELSKEKFLQAINDEVRGHLGTREKLFVLSTSVSMTGGFPVNPVVLGGAKVECYPQGFPVEYNGRNTFLANWKYKDPPFSPDHCAVLVSVKSKHWLDAAEQALDALDLVRGIFCFIYNAEAQFSLSFKARIENKISLGGMHCIHNGDGTLARDKQFWFEQKYEKAPSFAISDEQREIGASRFNEIVDHLSRHEDERLIKKSLIRYVRAIDNYDKNTSVMHLWSVLESLAGKGGYAADSIVRRCSFINGDRVFHQQVLEHLREYRNSSVHTGMYLESPDWHCFQLQRYFRRLVHFYLADVDTFNTIDEANRFLDLADSKEKLLSEIEIRQKALEFFGFNS